MSTRVARPPGGYRTRSEDRTPTTSATARRRSDGAARKPAGRSSKDHSDHDTECPMHGSRRGPAPAVAGKKRAAPAATNRSRAAPAAASREGGAPAAASKGGDAPAAASRVGATPPVTISTRTRPKGTKAAAGTRPAVSAPGDSPQPRVKREIGRPTATGRSAAAGSAAAKSRVSAAKPSGPSGAAGQPSSKERIQPKKPLSGKPKGPEKSGASKPSTTGGSSSAGTAPRTGTAGKHTGTRGAGDRGERKRDVTSTRRGAEKETGGIAPVTNGELEPANRARNLESTKANSNAERKRELGKVLDKLDLDEMYGRSNDKPEEGSDEDPIDSMNTWRTGDGDEEKMNELRTRSRKDEPRVSPGWNIEDLITNKKSERDRKTDSTKKANRYSFLVNSSDDDESDANSNEPETEGVVDFSRFDGFLHQSLSPDASKSPHAVKKPRPATEEIVRSSTAARSGTAVSRSSYSRSPSSDRDAGGRDVPASGRPQRSQLESLIRPAAPGRGPSPRREKRSPAPRTSWNGEAETAKPGVSSRDGRSDKSPRRSPANNRSGNARVPLSGKGRERERLDSLEGEGRPQKWDRAPRRADSMRSSANQQDAHRRRSRTPSPDARETYERYHDVYPDSEEDSRSPLPADRSSYRHRSPNISRRLSKARSPSPDAAEINYENPKTSQAKDSRFRGSLNEDYNRPRTAERANKGCEEENEDRRPKRKSLSLAAMTNPERNTDDAEGNRLRRLIMTTEALERRLFSP